MWLSLLKKIKKSFSFRERNVKIKGSVIFRNTEFNVKKGYGNMVKVAERRKMENKIKHSTTFMTYYRCALMEIETKLKVVNEQYSYLEDYNPIETIKTRLKTPESIAEKMERRGLTYSFENIEKEINDIAGIRVICPFISDIYVVSECLLQQEGITLLEKKDYIKVPKDNGYRSLHLIVQVPVFLQNQKRMMRVEIQLRTIAMDFWASLDHRLSYKKEMDPAITQQLHAELIACSNESARLDERMEAVRNAIDKRRSIRDWKMRNSSSALNNDEQKKAK